MTLFGAFQAQHLVRLSTIDTIIVVFYFALVLTIGFYLRNRGAVVVLGVRDSDGVRKSGDETKDGQRTEWFGVRSNGSAVCRQCAHLSKTDLLGWGGGRYIFRPEYLLLVTGGREDGFHLVFYRDCAAGGWRADFQRRDL
jgi:hypothetical protein